MSGPCGNCAARFAWAICLDRIGPRAMCRQTAPGCKGAATSHLQRCAPDPPSARQGCGAAPDPPSARQGCGAAPDPPSARQGCGAAPERNCKRNVRMVGPQVVVVGVHRQSASGTTRVDSDQDQTALAVGIYRDARAWPFGAGKLPAGPFTERFCRAGAWQDSCAGDKRARTGAGRLQPARRTCGERPGCRQKCADPESAVAPDCIEPAKTRHHRHRHPGLQGGEQALRLGRDILGRPVADKARAGQKAEGIGESRATPAPRSAAKAAATSPSTPSAPR